MPRDILVVSEVFCKRCGGTVASEKSSGPAGRSFKSRGQEYPTDVVPEQAESDSHPPKKPVVGNMLSLDSTAPVPGSRPQDQGVGPIFWLDMMGQPLPVIVSGFELVDELSDEKRFDKAVRGALRRVRSIGGDGLFTADTTEPNWSKAHNILLQPFGGRAMQSYHPMMVDIAEQLVKKWERLNADDEIDVVHDMTALAARHHRSLRVRLSFQFVLSGGLSPLRRRTRALAPRRS